MALFSVIALHIVDLLPTCFGIGGIVTTCVLCSTRTGGAVVEIGVQLGPPRNEVNDEIFTLVDGMSESLSSCTVSSGTGIGEPERRVGLYG